MFNMVLVFLGFMSCLLIAALVYPIQMVIKVYNHKKRIKNLYAQIRTQVDIKFDLIKKYIDINKDEMSEKDYNKINSILAKYSMDNYIDVEEMKEFNYIYIAYINNLDDKLMKNLCLESETKIGYVKDYYNELVCNFNRYKSSGVNNYISKALEIKDEKLY